MRKKILLAISLTALGLVACTNTTTSDNTEVSVESTPSDAEETVDMIDIYEGEITESEGEETFVGADEEGEAAQESSSLVITEATYKADPDMEANGQALFENAETGEFICNISDITELPEEGLTDGTVYAVTHTKVMAMSYPGILPTVYSIRDVESGMYDTQAELTAIDETAGELLFTEANGSQFLTDIPEENDLQEGSDYIVTHDMTMTRSMPGKYMNVTRIIPAV